MNITFTEADLNAAPPLALCSLLSFALAQQNIVAPAERMALVVAALSLPDMQEGYVRPASLAREHVVQASQKQMLPEEAFFLALNNQRDALDDLKVLSPIGADKKMAHLIGNIGTLLPVLPRHALYWQNTFFAADFGPASQQAALKTVVPFARDYPASRDAMTLRLQQGLESKHDGARRTALESFPGFAEVAPEFAATLIPSFLACLRPAVSPGIRDKARSILTPLIGVLPESELPVLKKGLEALGASYRGYLGFINQRLPRPSVAFSKNAAALTAAHRQPKSAHSVLVKKRPLAM